MDEARAVEQDVDRPERAGERLDVVARAHVELAPVGVEPFEGVEVDVGRDHPAPSRAKASAVARPIPAPAAVSTASLPANRPAMTALLSTTPAQPAGL